jgi:hypothetical protein
VGSSLLLNATVTPLTGRTATVAWTQVSGPGTTTFTNSTSTITGATFSTAGTYVLQLSANDGIAQSSQQVTVNVLTVPLNGPTDSMVLRLALDASTGTLAVDTSGVSPPNTGTLTPDPASNTLPTWEPTGGKINGALSFAGSNGSSGPPVVAANYQQVVVPDSATNLLDGMPKMSISFWLYANAFPPNSSNYAGLIVKRLGSFNKESYTIQLRGSTATAASIYTDIGGAGSTTLEGSSITTGQWYHCVVTFDSTQTTNNFTQYLNGALVKAISTTQTLGVPRNPTANLHIGAYDTVDTLTTNAGFNGLIDEVRIYNRVLSFPEVQALYQAVPTDVGPIITTASPLAGSVGQPLTLSASVTSSQPPASLSYNWADLNGPGTLTIASPTSLSTSTTPSQPGNYNLQFSANDGYVTTFASVTATITGQTFSSWATANGLTGNNAKQTAVLEPDGLNNLYKYSLGLNPSLVYNPGAAGLPVVQMVAVSNVNYLELSFDGVATDVTYTVQATSSLTGTWTTLATFPSGGSAPGNQTVQDNQPENVSSQRFMRLLMTSP